MGLQRVFISLVLVAGTAGLWAGAPPEGTALPFPNAGFEDGGAMWTLDGMSSVSVDQAASGRYSLHIVDADSDQGGSNVLGPRLPLDYAGRFEITGKVFTASGDGLGIYVRGYNAKGECLTGESHMMSAPSKPAGEWTGFRKDFIVPGGTTYLQVWLHSYSKSTVDVYVDDLCIRFLSDVTVRWGRDLATIKERLLKDCQGGTSPVIVGPEILAMRADGSWADVDYADQERTNWKAARHLERLLTMALAYRRGATDERLNQEILARGLRLGLDYWFQQDPKNPNWWWNVIGAPRTMYRILLLAEPALDADRIAKGCRIVERAKLGMTGQNLVWVAECTVARGCLQGEPLVAGEAFERIANEIQITTKEGVQPDFSFYQHGDQLYSGGYGKGFSIDCPHFAALAAGTSFAFAEDKVDIIVRYLLDGQQWMVRNRVFDYSACGRELARLGGGSSSGLERACDDAATLGHPRTAELKAFAARLRQGVSDQTPALVGDRYFWRAEYATHHRPEFFTSVRMASKRLQFSETCNGENLRGELLSDGVNYLYCNGEEYRRIMPVWDWRKLPGITAEQFSQPPRPGGGRGSRTFVGGVSDGRYGLAAMDFARGKLTARKAWFFFDDEYVCLGADIRCDSNTPVTTSLNQCLLQSEVVVSDSKGVRRLPRGEHRLAGVCWAYHGGVTYVLPTPGALTVRCDAQTGTWKSISSPLNDTPVSMDVFSAWIDHGKQVANGSYAYVVAPGVSQARVTSYAAALPVVILANRAEQQAVAHMGLSRAELVFYAPGFCNIPGFGVVSVDQPCALMVAWSAKGVALSAANPEHQALNLKVSLPGRWQGTGAKAEEERTAVSVSLPGTPELAGSTVTVNLSK